MSGKLSAITAKVIPAERELRLLAGSTLVNTFGNGLFMTVDVIYFTTIVGLSPAQVALAISIAGGLAMSLSVPAGHIADRFGPRDIAAAAIATEGIVMVGLVFVHSYAPFLLIHIVMGMLGVVAQTTRMATIAKLGGEESRVKLRAYQRAVTNFGISLGTLFAGIGLALNDPAIYKALLIGDAVTFVIAGALYLKLPFVEPTVVRGEPFSFAAMKDKVFLGATLSNAFMSVHFVLQSVAIPLWVVRETNAPRWWVSVIMMMNTIAVMLFQVAASKGSATLFGGAKSYRLASYFISLACLFYAYAHGVSAVLASIMLVLGMASHIVGELIGSAGSWSIGFGLADENHQGQYQGVWGLSWGLSGTLGPALVTALVIGMGISGWWILAAVFAVNGTVMHKIVTKSWTVTPELKSA
ncbi:MAG: MFS transporter [Candidatus Planktophila sp.]